MIRTTTYILDVYDDGSMETQSRISSALVGYSRKANQARALNAEIGNRAHGALLKENDHEQPYYYNECDNWSELNWLYARVNGSRG